jgi:hypothetical protein
VKRRWKEGGKREKRKERGKETAVTTRETARLPE